MKNVLVLLLVAITVLLNGCVGSVGNRPSALVYDFGLPAPRAVDARSWSKLAVEVKSPPWFDSLNVDYRLAYEDPLKRREYADSRWAGAPDALLAQSLRHQLGLVSASGSVAASCLLRIELQTFSQVFDSPTQSRGVLQASVSLFDHKRQRLAEQQMLVEKAAETADARGGVAALVSASQTFAQQLADWLASSANSHALKTCGVPVN